MKPDISKANELKEHLSLKFGGAWEPQLMILQKPWGPPPKILMMPTRKWANKTTQETWTWVTSAASSRHSMTL